MVGLVGGFVAPVAQQVKHLAHLRVQAQAGIHRAQQLGLGGLLQAHAKPRGHFLGERFSQYA